jgi:hypothetical protein
VCESQGGHSVDALDYDVQARQYLGYPEIIIFH